MKKGRFAGSRQSWKLILSCTLLLSCFPFSMLMEVHVSGPDAGLLGDYEQFVCVAEGSDVNSTMGVVWKYKLNNGEVHPISNDDMLSTLGFQKNQTGKITALSFIRLNSPNVQEILCQLSSDHSSSKTIEIRDLSPVDPNDDPCSHAENSGKPLTIIRTSSMDFVPPYRKNHYLDGNTVKLTYPTEASQVQLTCISGDNENPVWSLKKEQASNLKFSAWAELDITQPKCKKQLINIFGVSGEPGQTVTIELQCHAGSSKSPSFNLNFEIARVPRSRMMDFNDTQNCIDETVSKFYGKELTGVGVGSSLAIVLMMVGIAVMKKQLNNQQNINKQLMQGSPSVNPVPSQGVIP